MLNEEDLIEFEECRLQFFRETQFKDMMYRSIIYSVLVLVFAFLWVYILSFHLNYYVGAIVILFCIFYDMWFNTGPRWNTSRWNLFFETKSIPLESSDYEKMKNALEKYVKSQKDYYPENRE